MNNVVPFDRVLKRTQRPYLEKAPAAPFIKWAGGKRGIMPSIAQHFPDRVSTYYEPFLGGGAVFFTMANRIDRAILSDKNEELVLTYNVVKENVDNLIELLKEHEKKHKDDAYYLRIRKQCPTQSLEIAARFIYLNRTCF